ncbi:MAG TPA: hypothetical protein VNF47_23935 [Streptosporangiaceae bacterium]|nr:hypothetical protein [Streptosporangiaceae bacterium]
MTLARPAFFWRGDDLRRASFHSLRSISEEPECHIIAGYDHEAPQRLVASYAQLTSVSFYPLTRSIKSVNAP